MISYKKIIVYISNVILICISKLYQNYTCLCRCYFLYQFTKGNNFMAKYKKGKDNRYHAKVTVGHDADGKRIRKNVSGATIQELELAKAAIQTDVAQGTYADDQSLTVLMWAKKWFTTYKSHLQPSSQYDIDNIIRNHIKPLHNIRLKELRKSDIQQCITDAEGHYDIQRRIRLFMNEMLEDAIDDGLLAKNVCRKVELPSKPAARERILTEREKEAIEQCNFSLKQKCFVWLLWYTGIRPEEARALTRNDISFKKGEITIRSAVSFDGEKPVLKETKTADGERVIDILDPLLPVLRAYLDSIDTLYLFTTKSGSLMTKTSYRRFWEGIYNKINKQLGGTTDIKATNITPYYFRHEFATMLYYSGIDIKAAAKLMGHHDTQMILDVYAALDKKRSDTKNKLNDYLKRTI